MHDSLIKGPLSALSPKALRNQKILVFAITACLYSTLHTSRTAWAYSKPSLGAQLGLSDTALSILDSSFLCAYAIGLFLSGWLGDRVRLNVLLGRGLIATIIALTIFTVLFGYMSSPIIFIGAITFIVSGLGQSTGFPSCVTILTNWFPSGENGLVFGAWLVNINLGNILGQQIGKYAIDVLQLEWYYPVLASTCLIFFFTLLMLQLLYVHPSDVNTTVARPSIRNFLKPWRRTSGSASHTLLQDNSIAKEHRGGIQRSIGFMEALKAPGVILYSIIFTCLKSALYGLLFWLPMYLKVDVGFQEETAGLLASLEIGQLLGVVCLGYISDKLNRKAWLITSSLLCAVVTFFGISHLHSTEDKFAFMCLLFLAGLFVGGPSGLISSTVSSELGSGKASHEKKVKATATITGIIDGSGTVGAALTQLVIPYFRHYSFIYYTVVCLIAAILTPFAHRQLMRAKATKEADRETEQIEFTRGYSDIEVLKV